ncbi:MAG: RidA family protein [Gemmatimonadetes bacterium]|nr:RidA family protein [Gemmatimonadota bacterium]
MGRKKVRTENAPEAIGPYSQAIRAKGMIFTAGQIALVPGTKALAEGGVAEQTEQVLRNLAAVLEAGGSSLERIVKTTVYLKDMADFAAMNEVYARHLGEAAPARSTVAVRGLPLDALVEIDAVALLD